MQTMLFSYTILCLMATKFQATWLTNNHRRYSHLPFIFSDQDVLSNKMNQWEPSHQAFLTKILGWSLFNLNYWCTIRTLRDSALFFQCLDNWMDSGNMTFWHAVVIKRHTPTSKDMSILHISYSPKQLHQLHQGAVRYHKQSPRRMFLGYGSK